MTFKLQIPDECISDVLIAFLDAPPGWVSHVNFDVDVFQGYIGVDPACDPDSLDVEEGLQPRIVTRMDLVQGLEVMAERYPRALGNIVAKNSDCEDGDVLVQCAIWGKTLFG